MQNRVENIRYRKSHPSRDLRATSPNQEDFELGDEEWSSPPHDQSLYIASPPLPEPELRMLLPDEKINFNAIKDIYDHLQDQVIRLLHTLEATRRKLEELQKERDELLQFKNQTVGFYSMMHH